MNIKEKDTQKKGRSAAGFAGDLFNEMTGRSSSTKKQTTNSSTKSNGADNSSTSKEKNRKTEPKKEETDHRAKLSGIMKSEMTHFISGLIFFVIGVFLFISFFSFFFTGAEDQSSLDNLPFSQLTDVKNELSNWAGFFGAYMAELFINRWFGISSFLVSFMVIATGLKLMRVRNIHLWQIYIYSLVLMIWGSLFLGFFFISGYNDSFLYLGGKHGYYMSLLLRANIGWFGTFLVIFAFFIIIASFLYNPTIEYVRRAFNIELPRFTFLAGLFKRKERVVEETISEDEAFKIPDEPVVEESQAEVKAEEVEEPQEDIIPVLTEEDLSPSFEVVDTDIVSDIPAEKVALAGLEPVVSINDLYSRRFASPDDNINNLPHDMNAAVEDNYTLETDDYIVDTETGEILENQFTLTDETEEADDSWSRIEDVEDINEPEEYEPEQPSYSEKVITPEPVEQPEEEPEEEPAHKEAEFKVDTGQKDEILETPEDQLGEYDPTLDLSNYKFPTFSLLNKYDGQERIVDEEEQNANKRRIEETLNNYGIEIQSIVATVGPTITLYEIIPKQGVRISKIRNLEDDIALSLAALGIRIIAPIPGKGTVGIEVPNKDPQMVSMYSVIASRKFQDCKFDLPVALGKTITNEIFMLDLTKMPHILVAGATGQGKSVGLNAILTSLLYKKHPAQLKFVLIDPKKVEFNIYSHIEQHFLAKLPDEEEAIITDVTKVVATLNSICKEMDERYDLLKAASTRNIKEYNAKFQARRLNPEKGHKYMPYIVVVVDEFGDLIMTAGKEVELPIARIAQLARAVGIHMIIATQRPSTNIITGIIKANFPARIAFRVSSMIDSRTILDASGANQLIGRGDMLFSQGSDMVRIQCAFVDTPEVEQVCDFIGDQVGYPTAFLLPEYVPEGSEDSGVGEVDLRNRDSMFEDAARMVIASQQGSTSMIQRKFSIGYNRAGRIMDQLEAAGIVGPFEGSKARQVLVMDETHLQTILATLK